MTRTIALLLFTALFVTPQAAFTQEQAPGRGRGAGANLGARPPDAPPPRSTAPGPHAVTVESYPTLPMHTAYHPANLDAFGPSNLLPIVSWGNGACVRNGTAFLGFLTQIASHGYLAISIGPKDAPAGAARGQGGAAGAAPAERPIDDQMLLDAVDWAIAQNADPSSRFYRKVDTTKVAVMGQSCGGLQAIAVSHDPRVTTSVIWNSGVLPATGTSPARNLSRATKDSLDRLHAPIAYFIGGPTDVAYPNAEDDFARITKVPVFKANLNVGHGGTYRDPGGGWFGEVAVAWLDWRLKGRDDAARWFAGADCRLCTNPIWSVEKKGMR
jgi:dienelactone hydrolase